MFSRVIKTLVLISFILAVLPAAESSAAPVFPILPGDPAQVWFTVIDKGFGIPGVNQIFALEEFNGALYAVASSSTTNVAIYKSTDGITWELAPQVSSSGDIPANYTGTASDLHVFNNNLYLAVGKMLWRYTDGTGWEYIDPPGGDWGDFIKVLTTVHGSGGNPDILFLSAYKKIYASETGDSDSWVDVSPSLTNNGVWSMLEIEGYLFVGGEATSGGVKVYRGSISTPPLSVTWAESTNKPGFENLYTPDIVDPNPNNKEIGGFAFFNGELYTGTRNDLQGAEIWKLSTPTGQWQNVMMGGFGDPSNIKAEGFRVFNERLYVVMNSSETGTGMQIWSTADGANWIKEKDDRYSPPMDIETHWNNAFAEFNGRIFVGTRNGTTGGEIWAYPGWAVYLPLIKK